jgi:hypothetical protein
MYMGPSESRSARFAVENAMRQSAVVGSDRKKTITILRAIGRRPTHPFLVSAPVADSGLGFQCASVLNRKPLSFSVELGRSITMITEISFGASNVIERWYVTESVNSSVFPPEGTSTSKSNRDVVSLVNGIAYVGLSFCLPLLPYTSVVFRHRFEGGPIVPISTPMLTIAR